MKLIVHCSLPPIWANLAFGGFIASILVFAGCEGASREEVIAGGSGTPKPPSNLRTTAILPTQISLAWDDNSTNETGFKLERKKSTEEAYSLIKTLPENTLAGSDTGLLPAALYSYRVKAYNSAGDSAASAEIPVLTPWQIDSIDTVNSTGRYSSIALDSVNDIHISYFNETLGDLKYATNSSGVWSAITLEGINTVGSFTSIAVDENNKTHISYRNADAGTLKYATNATNAWITSVIDNSADVGEYTSIATDANSKVYISYYDITHTSLMYATNVSGTWVTATIDNSGDVGKYTSIAVDSVFGVHISYFDETNTALKYAYNVTGTWNTVFVTDAAEPVNEGSYTSIGVTSAGKIFISYFDDTNNSLKCATNKLGNWDVFTIDSNVDAGGYNSLKLSEDGIAYIAYYDMTNLDLRYATFYITSEFVNITTYPAVDSSGDVGQYCSIAIDSDKGIYISYYDLTNGDLKCAIGR
ncbi:MAG: fibronectin type III domain-containing protein [Planctomycetes bacterium]|nr:fibronectin type III domain-containing protein [Planctomycetota bacterium]